MANYCMLEIYIKFAHKNDANNFHNAFLKKIKKGIQDKQGVFIGSDRRFLDGVIRTPQKKKICITGCVRWALEQDEAAAFINFLKPYNIKTVIITYEEASSSVFGKYIYNGKSLKDLFIPQANPFWNNTVDNNALFQKATAILQNQTAQIIAI